MSNDFNVDGFSFTPDTPERQGEAYPRIWWYNGAKQAGTNGHFYTTEREFPDGIPGWTQVDRYEDEVGYKADALRIAVVRRRAQAYSEDRTSGMPVKTWHPHYKPGLRIYTELLCMVEGVADPVVWVVKGMLGKHITAKNGGLLSMHYENTVKQAIPTWKGQGTVPGWAFWCPIAAPKTDKGKPVYTDTGYGSHVTLPVRDYDPHVTREVLVSLFVGRDLLEQGLRIYQDSAEWAKTLRGNDDAPTVATPPSDDSVEPF
jgi:hypothetical protein